MSVPINAIPTPFLLIEESVVESNLSKVAAYASARGLCVRPHAKTHKSLLLARRQLLHGAVGLTVAKAHEAEVMSEVCDDILLAYPPVDPFRAEVAAKLARSIRMRVSLDTPEAIESLAGTARSADVRVGVLIDFDVGMGRTGVPTPARALELAQAASRCRPLRVDGLFVYPGHVWASAAEQASVLADVEAKIVETIDLFSRNGIACPIVSGGSTPTLFQSHLIPSLTEIRPGTYIFNDMNTVRGGYCSLDECAVRIVSTVISDAVSGKVLIDAGSKTLTSDRNAPNPESGFGYVVEFPAASITRLSEEHGELDIRACDRRPRVGERVSVIPNHVCPCINLQDAVYLRHGSGEVQRVRVDARGMVN
jgi:D-serine deaminase-like pyridoxal phosphate-dependent protein